jgi:soluble lytic murein transglycosylase
MNVDERNIMDVFCQHANAMFAKNRRGMYGTRLVVQGGGRNRKCSSVMYRRMVHRRYLWRRYAILSLVLAVLLGATWLAYRYHGRVYSFFIRGRAYEPLIQAAARRHGLDPDLLRAVIWQESRFNPNAIGSRGEVGLMQVRADESGAVAEWAIQHRRERPPRSVVFHPPFNIEIGAWYLARAMRRWDGYDAQSVLAMSEYNAGVNGMKWKDFGLERDTPPEWVLESIPITSTREYVRAIIDRYHEYCLYRKAEE